MTNLDLEAGLSYEFARRAKLSAGYRWDYWGGVALLNWTGLFGGVGTGTLIRQTHGVFGRLSYNLP